MFIDNLSYSVSTGPVCSVDNLPSDFEEAFKDIEKFVWKVIKITDVAQQILKAVTFDEFEGIPYWNTLIFIITVEEVLKTIGDKPFDKIDHYSALNKLGQFITKRLFTESLTKLSLGGVAAWANLASLPIVASLNRFLKQVRKKALHEQLDLYFFARDVGCSHTSIIDAQDNCPNATLVFDDFEGWLITVDAGIQGNKKCIPRGKACFPRPLSSGEVYDYAQVLYDVNDYQELKDLYTNDFNEIKSILENRIAACNG